MKTRLEEKDVKGLLNQLKEDLHTFPKGSDNLEMIFESTIKHLPVYLKIVKGHIEQLAKVLGLENHNFRNIEDIGLAEPVTQLMQLFQKLEEPTDIQFLERLAIEARNWTTNESSLVEKTVEVAISTV